MLIEGKSIPLEVHRLSPFIEIVKIPQADHEKFLVSNR